jgi:cyanophycinase
MRGFGRIAFRVALTSLPLFAAGGSAVAMAQSHPRGHLLIVGGGEQSDDLVRRFIDLAGGAAKARIAVIPMASDEPQATGDEKAEELRQFGAEATVVILTRAEAEDPASRARFDGMTGVWFCGGDQVPLARVLYDTPALAAIRARLAAGAVIGGTSAGAAIMSDSMLTGNQRRPDSLGYYGDEYPAIARGTIEVVRGLGFLHGAIVDQHFIRRERHNRLLSVVLERPSLIGVGIDEGTALEIGSDGVWHVVGASAVVVYDARQALTTKMGAPLLGASGIRLQILPAGSRFDPRSGRARLPLH